MRPRKSLNSFFNHPARKESGGHSQFLGHTEPPSCSGELTPRAVTREAQCTSVVTYCVPGPGSVLHAPHLICPHESLGGALSPTSRPRMRGSCWPRGLGKSAVELGLDPSCLTPAGVEGTPSLQRGSWVWRAVSFPLVKV